jgi:hypothetical protein
MNIFVFVILCYLFAGVVVWHLESKERRRDKRYEDTELAKSKDNTTWNKGRIPQSILRARSGKGFIITPIIQRYNQFIKR